MNDLNNISLNTWQGAIQDSAISMMQGLIRFLPDFLGAIVIFLIGILVGNWSKIIIIKALQVVKFESLIKDSKFKKFLKKAEITQKLEEVIGTIIKWVLLLVFTIAALNILGLTTISNLLLNILAYVPNVVSAVIVLTIGVLLAGVMENIVKGSLASIDLKTSRLMGKVTSYMIITITALVAISELNIAASFINILFIGFVTMLALGLGLAIGLGSKDMISMLLTQWHNNLKKELKK